jgi:DNA-nicking Smr family endonuclease
MTQAEAHARLFRYLSTAHTLGNRTILVITGKGVRGEGILRQAVPRWLAEPEFRAIASGFSEAHVSHGGSGALYVRVRNPRAGER